MVVLTESANSGIGSGNLYSFSAAQIRFDFLVVRSNEEAGVLDVVVDKEEGREVHKLIENKKFEGRPTTEGALQIPLPILLSTGFLLSTHSLSLSCSTPRVYRLSSLSLSLSFLCCVVVWEVKLVFLHKH